MLSDSQMKLNGRPLYREYALLGKGYGYLIKQDHEKKYIEQQVEQLLKQKKLVLILDLDNTLIHSLHKRSGLPIKENSFALKDKVFDIYDAQMVHKRYPGRYDVKCRPFLAEFMISLMPKF